MTNSEDEDTAPLGLPIEHGGTAAPGAQSRPGREPGDGERSPINRWHTRRFEFATEESVLVFTACVVALAMSSGVWPVVELYRKQVRLRLPSASEQTAPRREIWAELAEWARRLGGREVVADAGRDTSRDR